MQSLLAGDGIVFIEVGRMGEGGKWAVPTLVKLLSHQQSNIRALAAKTLGQIGAAAGEAKAALGQRLRDEHPVVRNAAQDALSQIEALADRDNLPAGASR
jgi:HEAT repeat protein